MKKTLLAGFAVGVMMLGMAGVASATTYNATNDFSITNGNPNGVWSYGQLSSDFTTFNLLQNSLLAYGNSPMWGMGPGESWIWQNQTGSVQGGTQTGQLALHPQFDNVSAVLRFTASSDAIYDVDGQFFAGDQGQMEVGVRKGADWLWQAHDQGAFDLSVTLAAGTSIDFVVSNDGYGWNNWCGTTPLEVTVSSAPVPEPATMLLMGTGLAGLIGVRRKKKA